MLRELDADLAVALTVNEDYDRGNPYWQHARYRWTAPDPADYGELFDAAQARLCEEQGLKPPQWRELLAIRGTWAGGVHSESPHPSASAVLVYSRWLLLRGLRQEGLLDRYDRFLITRSDFQWICPHPPLSMLDARHIWVPDNHHWSGVNDRHMVVSREHVEDCLNGLEEILLRPAALASAMAARTEWNDEQMLCLQLCRKNLTGLLKEFPYVMYLARSVRDRSATWSSGRYEPAVGHFVKYDSEFRAARAMQQKVRTAEDWERGEWRSVATHTPQPGATESLMERVERVAVTAKDRLARPRRIRRFLGRLRRSGVAGPLPAAPAVTAADYEDLARRRGW